MEQIILDLFKDIAPMAMAEKLTLFIVAWRIVRRDVNRHFMALESGIKEVAVNVSQLKDVVNRVEASHARRIFLLEENVEDLNSRVSKIQLT